MNVDRSKSGLPTMPVWENGENLLELRKLSKLMKMTVLLQRQLGNTRMVTEIYQAVFLWQLMLP